MGKRKSPRKASDREKKWDEIFNALVKLSKNLQTERQFLEDRIKYLHEVIYKMKMDQKFEASRAEFFLGLKEREAFVYKHRYENVDSELADFRQWFDYLVQKCEEPKDDVSSKGEGSRNKALQNEVKKLKCEIEKCKSDKNTEVTALLAEKNFVWHQLKKTEDDLNKEIKRKDEEVKHAHEKLRHIVNASEELQVSHEKLRTDFSRLESDSVRKSEEISRLLKEIDLLKSRSESPSTLLHPCKISERGGKSSGDTSNGGGVIKVKKEADNSRSSGKTSQTKQTARKSTGRGKAPKKPFTGSTSNINSSKRKAVEVITIEDSPRLFTSNFKVPKLKPSASRKID
ncbi:cytomatrix family protein [Striga asiatica]|uniref:Cytomatrix family protein n=1 Tax=Striga asiatica TaxID=4170 RepID=A0A5A7P1C0_STRAF|nr:cytomatrix family protein [Striga asiatica]